MNTGSPPPVPPSKADGTGNNTETLLPSDSQPVLISSTADQPTRVGAPTPSASSASGTAVLHFIGGYAVVKKIGEGGMGAVYLAEDTKLNRKVAIKTMKPELATDPENRNRFEREARAAAAVEHENIVPIWGIGEAADGSPFIAMPFLQGEMLSDRLRRHRVASLSMILKVARDVADGLSAAHAKGLIHRDIKPGNIWLDGDLTSREPKQQVRRCMILDFGLARSVDNADSQLTATGAVLGTPPFMAPEQARGAFVDHRTDLFSLGVTLYYMATGKLPFTGPNSMAVLFAVTTETPSSPGTLNPNLPPALSDLIDRLMCKDPTGRPQSALEVSATVRQIIKDVQTKGAVPESVPLIAKPQAAAAWEEVTEAEVVSLPKPKAEAKSKPKPEPEPLPEPDEPKRSRAPKSKPKAKASGARNRLPWFIAGGVLALIALVALAVVVLRLETGEGTLVVEINDPDVEARIKNGKLVLVGPDGKERYTITANDRNKKIAAGEYTIRVEGADGLVLDTIEFTLKKNGEVTVRVTLDPKVAKKPDPPKKDQPGQPVGPAHATFKNTTGMEFVKVPKGTARAAAVNVVFDKDFYLGKFEVTQEEWQKVIGTNPSWFSRTGKSKDVVKDIKDADLKRFPVESVSWDDCQLFLKKLNEKEKEAGWVYRLPTRKEWEYACRGGPVDKADYDFGFYFAKPTNEPLLSQANFKTADGKGLDRPCPVGSYPPNRLGLHDMHGNVWEWCDDTILQQGKSYRVTISGGWYNVPEACRVDNVFLSEPSSGSYLNGLRVVRVPTAPAVPVANADADRKAAEYVLSVGGTVRVDGTDTDIKAAKDLPKGPFSLTAVGLSENERVTDAGLACFKNCNNLIGLNLFHAINITDAGVAHFAGCKNLLALNLGWTSVTDAGMAHFAGCKNLVNLDLYLMPITDAGLVHFKDCENLGLINLGGNDKVTDAGLATFKNCKNLIQFHLFNTAKVTDEGLAHFAGCKNITGINLGGTKVTDAGLAAVKKFAHLTELILWNTQISDAGLAHLHGHAELKALGLGGQK